MGLVSFGSCQGFSHCDVKQSEYGIECKGAVLDAVNSWTRSHPHSWTAESRASRWILLCSGCEAAAGLGSSAPSLSLAELAAGFWEQPQWVLALQKSPGTPELLWVGTEGLGLSSQGGSGLCESLSCTSWLRANHTFYPGKEDFKP